MQLQANLNFDDCIKLNKSENKIHCPSQKGGIVMEVKDIYVKLTKELTLYEKNK